MLKKVAEKVDMPVATGERVRDRIEFRELFEDQSAETHYTLIAPHNVGGSVLTAASLQLAACTPNFKILEHFNDFADSEIKKVVTGAPQVDPETGCFEISHAPGLGVELDVEAAAEFPQQKARFDLWADDWEQRKPE